jgi:hypothetical protein
MLIPLLPGSRRTPALSGAPAESGMGALTTNRKAGDRVSYADIDTMRSSVAMRVTIAVLCRLLHIHLSKLARLIQARSGLKVWISPGVYPCLPERPRPKVQDCFPATIDSGK